MPNRHRPPDEQVSCGGKLKPCEPYPSLEAPSDETAGFAVRRETQYLIAASLGEECAKRHIRGLAPKRPE